MTVGGVIISLDVWVRAPEIALSEVHCISNTFITQIQFENKKTKKAKKHSLDGATDNTDLFTNRNLANKHMQGVSRSGNSWLLECNMPLMKRVMTNERKEEENRSTECPQRVLLIFHHEGLGETEKNRKGEKKKRNAATVSVLKGMATRFTHMPGNYSSPNETSGDCFRHLQSFFKQFNWSALVS